MIFNRFLTWMVFERLPNRNDYKFNNKLRDFTLQKRNQVPLLQTHCTPLASCYARAPSVWWCCLPRISIVDVENIDNCIFT